MHSMLLLPDRRNHTRCGELHKGLRGQECTLCSILDARSCKVEQEDTV